LSRELPVRNWENSHYYYSASWQVVEERFANDVSNDNKNVPATAVKVQWLWDQRYIDAPVLRWRDADGWGRNGLEETLYFCNDANMNVTALVKGAGRPLRRRPPGFPLETQAEIISCPRNSAELRNHGVTLGQVRSGHYPVGRDLGCTSCMLGWRWRLSSLLFRKPVGSGILQ
jgi:hypothetical protein